MTNGERLINNFPSTIRKDSKIFSALVANSTRTGALETVIDDLEKYANEYSKTKDIYDEIGEMLDKTTDFFTFLERFTDEYDEALKNRIAAIFVRNNDEKWGNPHNVKNVFRQYFKSGKIFLIENTDIFTLDEDYGSRNKSLVVDGDFQNESELWELSNNSIIDPVARFSRSYGLLLESSSDFAKQDIEVDTSLYDDYEVRADDTYTSIAKMFYGNETLADYIKEYSDNPDTLVVEEEIKIPKRNVYFLHFFLKGSCGVIIKDSDNNKYWNNIEKKWQNASITNTFTSKTNEWTDINLFTLNGYKEEDTYYSVQNIQLTFIGNSGGYVDYIRLFKKQDNPSFSMLCQFEGNTSESALALATGGADIDAETHTEDEKIVIDGPEKFDNFGYYENVYITGATSGFAQDLYDDLLEYVKSSGVQTFLEIVNRDE